MTYALQHPFLWLISGNNAAGVQAIAAVVATLAAIVAGYFAGRAYFATVNQVRLVERQLDLAHKQFETEKLRFEEEKRHLMAQQKINQARERATFLQRKSEEDSERPMFSIWVGSFQVPSTVLKLTNLSSGTALKVSALDPATNHVLATADRIEPHKSIEIAPFNPGSISTLGIDIMFTSTYGSKWKVNAYLGQRLQTFERNATAHYPYAPDLDDDPDESALT